DRDPAIRVNLEGTPEQLILKAHVRLVVNSLPLFFFDDFALRFNTHRINLRMQHALGFYPQSERELIGRQYFMVERAVLYGIGIERAAGVPDILVDLAAGNVFCSFEEEVFKKVSKSRSIRIFILRAYVVEYGHCHNRG